MKLINRQKQLLPIGKMESGLTKVKPFTRSTPKGTLMAIQPIILLLPLLGKANPTALVIANPMRKATG
jgi:hypothetical protein